MIPHRRLKIKFLCLSFPFTFDVPLHFNLIGNNLSSSTLSHGSPFVELWLALYMYIKGWKHWNQQMDHSPFQPQSTFQPSAGSCAVRGGLNKTTKTQITWVFLTLVKIFPLNCSWRAQTEVWTHNSTIHDSTLAATTYRVLVCDGVITHADVPHFWAAGHFKGHLLPSRLIANLASPFGTFPFARGFPSLASTNPWLALCQLSLSSLHTVPRTDSISELIHFVLHIR